jgi:hypothetical protein
VGHGIGSEILGYRIDAEVGTSGKGVVCRDEQASRAFLLFSTAVIFANLIADIGYSYLDPRVRAA